MKKKKKIYKKRRKNQKKLIWICSLALALAVVAVGFALTFVFLTGRVDRQVQEGLAQLEELETTETESGVETETTEWVSAEEEIAEVETETETETEIDPWAGIELTEEQRKNYVKVSSCEIDAATRNVVLSCSVDEFPASDDRFFYLIEMKMYEDTIDQERKCLDAVFKSLEFKLDTPVCENTADSKLLSKLVVAVKINGEYVPLCTPQYVSNPEVLASYTAAFPQTASKKGLLPDPLKIRGSELDNLGVKHAAYNVLVSNILGNTTHGDFPTIHYTYNGRTYKFNGQRIAEYDIVFSELTKRGIVISAIILNNNNGTQPQLVHPLSRGGRGNYYAFNTEEEDGIQTMAAVAAFLSQRYRDAEHGVVMNWIIGNEVNVRESWNYMQKVDLNTYSQSYADAVRVFYNVIRSMNANARVYLSMDQQWDRNLKNNPNYDVRDMLDTMSRQFKAEGDIDWGLAHHPYALPLTDTVFWTREPGYGGLVTNAENTSFITMENIEVLTNYMQRSEMLMRDGQVRPIILSELGYSSTKGEANQAAAFVYTYYKVEANPHIDSLILSRQTDAGAEIAQDLALGLTDTGGRRKYIYEVFKHIDGPNSAAVTEFAKPIIGITSWSQIGSNR